MWSLSSKLLPPRVALKQSPTPRACGIGLQRTGWEQLKEEKVTKGMCGEGRRPRWYVFSDSSRTSLPTQPAATVSKDSALLPLDLPP